MPSCNGVNVYSAGKIVAGAGMTGKKMAKRTGDVDEFEFDKLGNNHQQGVSFCFNFATSVCFLFGLNPFQHC